ncbi:MAG: nitrate ABC transporter substrate-binding protein, partial [Gammaproteobacteria bacterium]
IDTMGNRPKVAQIISQKSYVNTEESVLVGRMKGEYDNGNGKKWKDENYMKFYNDGQVTFPYLSDGMWFLTQHRRWGLLKDDPDYLAIARQVNQIALYKQAAALAKAAVPKEPMRSSKLIDGVVWDGSDPARYAGAFKVRAS